MTTRLELTVLNHYRAYVQVFLEAELESISSHGLQNLIIKLINGKQHLWDQNYSLLKMELETLCSNLNVQLKRG
jgi:hypothetical protein